MNADPDSMTAIVSEKGQVTIPKPLRDRLGLVNGQVLAFAEEHGRLVAVKVVDDDPIRRVAGTMDLPGGTDQFIDEIRGPADLP